MKKPRFFFDFLLIMTIFFLVIYYGSQYFLEFLTQLPFFYKIIFGSCYLTNILIPSFLLLILIVMGLIGVLILLVKDFFLTSKGFVIDRLKILSKKIPGVKIRYQKNDCTGTHIIEINPISVFKGNEDFMMTEKEIKEHFKKMFPTEEVLFISEGSLMEIDNEHEILFCFPEG